MGQLQRGPRSAERRGDLARAGRRSGEERWPRTLAGACSPAGMRAGRTGEAAVPAAASMLAGSAGSGVGTCGRGQIRRCRRRCSWARPESAARWRSWTWLDPAASALPGRGQRAVERSGDLARAGRRNGEERRSRALAWRRNPVGRGRVHEEKQLFQFTLLDCFSFFFSFNSWLWFSWIEMAMMRN